MASRVAEIVEAMHAKGVVHCDLTLENIVIDKDEHPHLVDFDRAHEIPEGVRVITSDYLNITNEIPRVGNVMNRDYSKITNGIPALSLIHI